MNVFWLFLLKLLIILYFYRHWTSKDCRPWTKSYFAKELIVSAEKNGIFASITKLTDCTGDVDVSMRKGKIITIYDLKIVLEFNGFMDISM